jgi:hypothetical protein
LKKQILSLVSVLCLSTSGIAGIVYTDESQSVSKLDWNDFNSHNISIKVRLNGQELNSPDAMPFTNGLETVFPVRFLAEILGGKLQ